MCLITTAANKKLIKPEALERAYENNPHGFGIVYAQDNKLFVCKRLSSFETFLKLYELVPDDSPIAIHFRWQTHGDKSVENVHPYTILDQNLGDPVDIAMMHNGVISGVHSGNDPRSDTACYIDEYLRPIIKENPDIIFNEAFTKLVGRDIGSGNKLLFLHGNGERIFVNKKAGHENEKDAPGVWFSNSYSFNSNHRSTQSHQRGGFFQNGVWKAWQENSGGGTGGSASNVYKTNEVVHTARKDMVFESSEDFSDEMKKLITNFSVSAKLLSPKQPNYSMGYGWIMYGTIMHHGGPVLAALHKQLIAARELKGMVTKIEPKVVELINTNSSMNSLVTKMEKNFDKSNFMAMGRTEILEWVLEYPREAAEFLLRYLRMSGGVTAVDNFVQQNPDQVTEAIYMFAHHNQIVLDTPKPKEEEQDIDYMIAM